MRKTSRPAGTALHLTALSELETWGDPHSHVLGVKACSCSWSRVRGSHAVPKAACLRRRSVVVLAGQLVDLQVQLPHSFDLGEEAVRAAGPDGLEEEPLRGVVGCQPVVGSVVSVAEADRLGLAELDPVLGVPLGRAAGLVGDGAGGEAGGDDLVEIGPGGELMRQMQVPAATEAQVGQLATLVGPSVDVQLAEV